MVTGSSVSGALQSHADPPARQIRERGERRAPACPPPRFPGQTRQRLPSEMKTLGGARRCKPHVGMACLHVYQPTLDLLSKDRVEGFGRRNPEAAAVRFCSGRGHPPIVPSDKSLDTLCGERRELFFTPSLGQELI